MSRVTLIVLDLSLIHIYNGGEEKACRIASEAIRILRETDTEKTIRTLYA